MKNAYYPIKRVVPESEGLHQGLQKAAVGEIG